MSWTVINEIIEGVFRNSPKMNDIVWFSTVGSHMWQMNHEGSDLDLFEVFIQDTYEILAGRWKRKGKEIKCEGPSIVEKTRFEIGHVVEQLQKGNINFLWGLASPIFGYTDLFWRIEHRRLKKMVLDNLSKNYIHSITGLVRQNLAKYFGIEVKTEDDETGFAQTASCKLAHGEFMYKKKLKLMYRTLAQGYILLKKHVIEFPSVSEDNANLASLERLYKDVIEAYEESELPEKPDSKPFDEFLVKIRLRYLDVLHPKWLVE